MHLQKPLAAVLAATVLLPAQASSAPATATSGTDRAAAVAAPTTVVVRDKVDVAAGLDIRKVTLRSAVRGQERAAVVVRTRTPITNDHALAVWVNTDADRQPDMVMSYLLSGSVFDVARTRSFTKVGKDITARGCAGARGYGKRLTIALDPGCLGRSRTFSVSVMAMSAVDPNLPFDHVPRRDAFTPKVRSFGPAPADR